MVSILHGFAWVEDYLNNNQSVHQHDILPGIALFSGKGFLSKKRIPTTITFVAVV